MVLLHQFLQFFLDGIRARPVLVVEGESLVFATALGSDFKGKISIVLYVIAVPSAFIGPWIAAALYIAVAVTWLVPDRRIEKKLAR